MITSKERECRDRKIDWRDATPHSDLMSNHLGRLSVPAHSHTSCLESRGAPDDRADDLDVLDLRFVHGEKVVR